MTKKNTLLLLVASTLPVAMASTPTGAQTPAAAVTASPASQLSNAQVSTSEPANAARPVATADGRLVLYNTHTNERLDIVYRRGGRYLPDALAKLDYFLRDHNTSEIRHFDPRLYDILSSLTVAVGRPAAEIAIVCGYRTPSTNEALREHTTGVAKNSLHIQAEAIDLRIPGVNTLTLRRAALALRQGGVGYYPHSDFIHVDVGRVRQWCFDCPASIKSGD
jgi:uncharacterized protein YcbK (DUF882 family)